MKPTKMLLLSLLLALMHTVACPRSALSQIGVLMQGRVVYRDGSPAGGARVDVVTACANKNVQYVQDTLTSPDGRFSLNSYDSDCNQYKFSASHREAFWLPTGDNIFYMARNGTTPIIELKPGQVPASVLIRLEQRGGEVELKAFDKLTRSYVYAGLGIRRERVGKKTFGGRVSTATGDDGSSLTLFLPPGKYVVKVERYMCHGKAYFAARPPTFRFTIEAGMRHSLMLEVNIAELQSRSSYDNPKAERCSP